MNINQITCKHILITGVMVILTLSSNSCTAKAKKYKFVYGNTGRIYSVMAQPNTKVLVFKQYISKNNNDIPENNIEIQYKGQELKNRVTLGDKTDDVLKVMVDLKQQNKLQWHPKEEHIGNLPLK